MLTQRLKSCDSNPSSSFADLYPVVFLLGHCVLAAPTQAGRGDTGVLVANQAYSRDGPGRDTKPSVYCHYPASMCYLRVFAATRIEFVLPPSSYELFEGATVEEVLQNYENHSPNWIPLVPWRSSTIVFPPFQSKCVGILSEGPYRFVFRSLNIDFFRVLQCALCLFLFFTAKRLVRSRALFYSGGVSVGVMASLLILVFILSRLVPRKGMWGVLFMGWSFSIYVIHKIWSNLYDMLFQYKSYVLAYFGLSALISFAICYRWGPPTNERTHDLMQWLLQAVALIGVYCSSDLQVSSQIIPSVISEQVLYILGISYFLYTISASE